MNIERRTFLASVGTIALGGLAGCSTIQDDINLTADPVGISKSTAGNLDLELDDYITDVQEQELSNPEDSDPIMLRFKLNILLYNSTVQNEQANLAFVSTGSHEVVGQEINPISQVTPRQIIQNVTSIEDQSQIEELGTESITHSEYGELTINKYRTTIKRFGEEITLINYGFTDKFKETLILGLGSHMEGNSQRRESIKQGLSSFDIPTDAVEGMEPTDIEESTIASVTDVEDIDMEELPF